jgi:hypothetical protein
MILVSRIRFHEKKIEKVIEKGIEEVILCTLGRPSSASLVSGTCSSHTAR